MSLLHSREQAVDQQGRPTASFYRWYRRVEDALASVVAATPADTSNFLTRATSVTGGEGIDVDGALATGAVVVSVSWGPHMARLSLGV